MGFFFREYLLVGRGRNMGQFVAFIQFHLSLLNLAHGHPSWHVGVNKTRDPSKTSTTDMEKMLTLYVKPCDLGNCHDKTKATLHPLSITKIPFQRVVTAILGPIHPETSSMSQHEYIMTLSHIDAKSMNQFLMDLSARTTSPIEVSTDAGMNLSGIITNLWAAHGDWTSSFSTLSSTSIKWPRRKNELNFGNHGLQVC